MGEPWALYGLVFLLVAVAVLAFQHGMGGLRTASRQKKRRFASLAATADPGNALRRRETSLDGFAPVARINRLILQTGLAVSMTTLAIVTLGLAFVVYLLLPAQTAPSLRISTAILVGGTLVWIALRTARSRRVGRFAEQLPEVIDVIVRSLKAGHPLAVSLSLVAREMPEPAGREFTLVVDEINYGRSVTEAMESLSVRVGYRELRFFVAAIAIAQQTGGNLGEILSRLSRLLRERSRLSRRVRALTAEGRFSGYALSIMPVALFGLINLISGSYYADFWASPASTPVAAISLGLLVIGNAIIYRLVNFKF